MRKLVEEFFLKCKLFEEKKRERPREKTEILILIYHFKLLKEDDVISLI